MKILVISNLYPPFQLGGYEIGCRNVVSGLRNLGHEVSVLTSPSHAIEESEEPGIFRYLQLNSFQPICGPYENMIAENNLKAMITNYTNTSILLDLLNEHKPDCVYCFNLVGIGGIALMDALNTLDYPWILHLMDKAPDTLQHGISPPILELYHANNGDIYKKGAIISMTKHLINEIEMDCGFSFHDPVNIVPGWADPPTPIIDRAYCIQGNVRFVTAGAVQPHKGIDLIIDAVTLLQSNGINNFTVEIYGEGKQAHYVDLCKQHNVFEKISFPGSRTQAELMDIYQSSDAFLFPTWEREPFGFAPIEAASVGCVPIITASCGAAERLVDKVHCIKIKKDSQQLFEAMKLICTQQVNLEHIGNNGQIITRHDLSFQNCLKQIEDILKDKIQISETGTLPNWEDTNLAYLKHNLSNTLLHQALPQTP